MTKLTFSLSQPTPYASDMSHKLKALRGPTASWYLSDLHAAIDEVKPGSVGRLRELAQRYSYHCGDAFSGPDYAVEYQGSRQLCALIEQKNQEFRRALDKTGLPQEAIQLFTSFVDFRLDSQAALHELELARLIQALKGRDTAQMGTAEELAQALEVSSETVRRRTLAGTLIAVLGPGRKRGREYPMFQAWPGIAGAPLEAVLKALGRPDGAQAYQFMTSPNDALGGMSPIEVLVGEVPDSAEVAPGARDFIQEDDESRLRAVVEAATARAAAAEAA